MKLGTRLYAAIALVAAILLIPIAIYSVHPNPSATSQSKISKTSHLTPHERIVIRDAGEFTTPGTGRGCECARGGSGSRSDPFVISDWKLSVQDGDGISIAGTGVHFTILNVMVNVTEARDSLVLRGVANGTIQDSYFFNGGISLFNSNAISILNNTITGSKFGILLETSNNNTISGNQLHHIDQVGIFVRAASNLIDGNLVAGGSYGGINIDGMTGLGSHNRIVNNLVEGNLQYGLGLWDAWSNLIKGNVISDNGGAGIMVVASCSKNLIEQNRVVNNSGDGILLGEQSTDNKIIENTVTGNGNEATSFDLHDEGSGNIWLGNTFGTRKTDTIG